MTNTLRPLVALAFALTSAGSAHAANSTPLLPLTSGTVWKLDNTALQITYRLTVSDVTVSPTATFARIKFDHPWGSQIWIVKTNETGASLVGIGWGGVDYNFADPMPLFPAATQAGQSWSGQWITTTVASYGLTVTTPTGTYQNCVRYRVNFLDGSIQYWTLAPNVGIVGAGADNSYLTLTGHTVPAAVGGGASAPVIANVNCPPVGIAAMPQDASLRTADREGALAAPLQAGVRFLGVSTTWQELEPSPGVYSAARVLDELSIASKYNLKAALHIRVIDNVARTVPSDLANTAWNSATMINRYNAALDYLISRVPAQVQWVNLAYEVDPYFFSRPAEMAAFTQFFTSAKQRVKGLKNVSVGMVFSFDSSRTSNQVYSALYALGDHVGFNYYAIAPVYNAFQLREPTSPALDVPIMVRMAAGKPIVISEVGYATSSQTGGSEAGQKQFFDALFTEIGKNGGKFGAVNLWSLRDLTLNLANNAAATYAVNTFAGYAGFLTSLGLQTAGGTWKQAWTPVNGHIANFNRTAGCTQQQ